MFSKQITESICCGIQPEVDLNTVVNLNPGQSYTNDVIVRIELQKSGVITWPTIIVTSGLINFSIFFLNKGRNNKKGLVHTTWTQLYDSFDIHKILCCCLF